MRSADYRVEVVDASAQADVAVVVVNSVVVDLSGAAAGDVLTIQPDGSIAADPVASGPTSVIDDPRYRMLVAL